jgi:enamine deaminase RidA (YjgF/YER057c/UK114 family)
MDTQIIASGKHKTLNPYESKFGYSRSLRRGPFIFVSGTTAVDLTGDSIGKILHPASAHQQALKIFDEIISAVQALDGKKEDVVRIRMFVTRDEDAEDVGRALKEVFGDVRPVATMILGARFVDPEMRVEIEADAVVFW